MRSTLIGIVIGVVAGVLIGATIVAPGLEKARQAPPEGAEALALGEPEPAPTEQSSPRPSRTTAYGGDVARFRIINLFPPKLPVLGEMAQRLEHELGAASGGAINAKLFAPGALVPASDTFDAVASGAVEAAFASPGQWDPESPALQLFTAIPFGPDASELLAWFYHGGGRALFEEQFQRRGVHAVLCGAIPPEGSGWYMAPVRGAEDFEGLNIRAFGLGAKVLRNLGANAMEMDAGEVLAAFEERRLDGAEYSLPSVDAKMGFHKFARNYYFPGWQQPATLFTLGINETVWKGLSPGARAVIDQTCADNVLFALTRADAIQFEALKELGLAGVQVRRWPDPVLDALQEAWKSVRRELIQENADFAKVWTVLQRFRRDYSIWRDLSRP